MDYEVFLVSRIAQHHAAGEDPRQAVRSGLAGAAKVIAAAAIIMIAVFASFILNSDPTVKQFGVGLSVAVLLAGSMTLMLAPGLLCLCGRWTWTLPRWLAKVLPHVDIEGEGVPQRKPEAPEPVPAGASAAAVPGGRAADGHAADGHAADGHAGNGHAADEPGLGRLAPGEPVTHGPRADGQRKGKHRPNWRAADQHATSGTPPAGQDAGRASLDALLNGSRHPDSPRPPDQEQDSPDAPRRP